MHSLRLHPLRLTPNSLVQKSIDAPLRSFEIGIIQPMKTLNNTLILTLLALVCSCASTNKVVLDNTQRAPTTSVEVFKDGKVPTRKYKEIAELSFLGPREDELRAQKYFVKEAQKMGGNGLLFHTEQAGQKGGFTIFQTTAFVFKANIFVYE
jgi:hypothetical protein